MKNTGGRFGGSITAAQFIQRFVGDVPWAHLDIAGTAMSSPATEFNRKLGLGWGVRCSTIWWPSLRIVIRTEKTRPGKRGRGH